MPQKTSKKIIFCDNSLRELINFRGDIINCYASKGYDIVLIAPVNCDYTSLYENVKLCDIKMNRASMNPCSDFMYLLKLIYLYRREKPDYIFHYTIKPNIYGSFASKILGIPSSAMIAGLGYVFANSGVACKIARFLYKIAMRCPEKVLVLNKYNHDILIDRGIVNPQKIILLKGGEGVNLSKFNNDV